MKTLLIFPIVGLCATSLFSQKIVEGKAANAIIPGASLIRFVEHRSAPDYIQISPSLQLTDANALTWINNTLHLKQNESFVEKRTEVDELGMEHKVYQHYISGIPVEFSEYRTHAKNHIIQSVNGEFYQNLSIDVVPTFQSTAAIEVAKQFIGATTYRWESEAEETALKARTGNTNATFAPSPQLTIVAKNGNYFQPDFRLCWKMDIYASAPLSRNWVYVDAHTGEIIWKNERIHELDTPGTGTTGFSGSRAITTDSFGGTFRLRETGRGNGVETFNLNNGTNYGAATDFVDTDNNWINPTPAIDQYALDAHWGAEMCYDYYNTIHNRNSLDNNGFKLISYVHYSTNYANAFWDGLEMTYGDGGASGFNEPLTTLDIAGHEITHGLTSNTADLVYQDQSGALNESFSDIFGVTIDNFARGTTGTPLWRIGEEATTSGNGIRLMSNPSAFGDPDTYEGTNWIAAGGTDNGGVHINSGVQNFWYYLLVTGGTGTNDNGTAYNVTGIGIADAADIAFRNLTVYLGANSQFADARFYSIKSAQDLFGGCSPQVISTTKAWYAVGVGADFSAAVIADFTPSTTSICSAPASVVFSNISNNGQTYNWYFGDGTTSTVLSPTHVFTANGTYSISLAVDGGACGTDSIAYTSLIQVSLPAVATATNAQICQTPSSVTLTSTTSGTGAWYSSSVSSTPLFIGDNFTTPNLSTNTTYYVENQIPNGAGNVGPATNVFGTGGNHNNTSTQYIEFTVLQKSTIHTVDVVSASAGVRTIQIWDGAGNPVTSVSPNIAAGNSTVTIEKTLAPGNYRIGGTEMDLYRNNAGATYPYTLTNLIEMTGSSAGSAFYYYFYNWDVSSSCTSTRIPVIVSVSNTNAAFTSTSTGTSTTFTSTSTGTATWNWDFGNGNTSTLQNPTFDFGAPGSYPVTLIVTNTNGACSDTITTIVTVSNSNASLDEVEWNNQITVQPNPFIENVSLTLNFEQSNLPLSIRVTNGINQEIGSLFTGKSTKGKQQIDWNTSSLSAGIYYVHIQLNGEETIRKIVKL